MIVLLTKDLFFSSKITGTAQALGISMVTCATLDRLREVCQQEPVSGLILDLGMGLSPAAVLAAAADHPPRVRLAFGAHVDTASLEAARDAGFEQVLPRSRLSAELPQLLRHMAGD